MKRASLAALCAMFASCALASDAVTAPASGTYASLIYVQSAGSGCLDVTGATYFGEASFGGLSNKKLTIRIPLAGNGLAVSSVQTLSVTIGSGTTHQSGTLACRFTALSSYSAITFDSDTASLTTATR